MKSKLEAAAETIAKLKEDLRLLIQGTKRRTAEGELITGSRGSPNSIDSSEMRNPTRKKRKGE